MNLSRLRRQDVQAKRFETGSVQRAQMKGFKSVEMSAHQMHLEHGHAEM